MQRCIQLTGTNRSKICPFKTSMQNLLRFVFLCQIWNSGDYSGGVTPVPIPNTEVKSSSAYGTRFILGELVVAGIPSYEKQELNSSCFFLPFFV